MNGLDTRSSLITPKKKVVASDQTVQSGVKTSEK